MREIDAWLLSLIPRDGSVPVAEIRRQAVARGYAWPTVERAKRRLGLEAQKTSWSGGWAWSDPWAWSRR